MTTTSASRAGGNPNAAADDRARPDSPGPGPGQVNGGMAARPQLIRALNEQLLLSQIRQLGPCSRADLARLSGLSKPTVSLALANVERSGLVRDRRAADRRAGALGPAV